MMKRMTKRIKKMKTVKYENYDYIHSNDFK